MAPFTTCGGERDAEGQRVAVGHRAGDPTGPEIPVRASNVFDDERLAEGVRMRSATIRNDHVRCPPRPDGTTIVIGRDGYACAVRDPPGGRNGGSTSYELQKLTARKFLHVSSPKSSHVFRVRISEQLFICEPARHLEAFL